MVQNNNEIEKRLWDAADELRANSKLKASEYSVPVLGLIFLRYADHKFSQAEKELEGKGTGRKKIGKSDYQALGVLYLPDEARFKNLLDLPEGENIGKAINEAMRAVEADNPDLKDVLPKSYNRLDNATLVELLKLMASIHMDIKGDAFGKIYEYFLGNFAMSEGQKGGEFFTPTSIVRLIVNIIEPYQGRIFDPACGSGGMFVQSARFVDEHKRNPNAEISVFGEERVSETVRLCKMNLAVHGLAGDIRQGNTYYEDLHNSTGKFDFVMANPPFNVNRVDKERLKDDPRFPFGMPRVDNANYLWIQIFYSTLNDKGRAGFVMANSASDARASEQDIRQKLIEDQAVDVMVAIGPNFFYTVTLPCTLWFIDKAKAKLPPSPGTSRHPLPRGEGNVNYRGGLKLSGLVKKARELRRSGTPAEECLWELLRNLRFAGLKFRRQHQIGDYIVDFYCHEHRLAVELDGGVHDGKSQREHDKKRDRYIKSLGNTVIRIKNKAFMESTEKALEQIVNSLPSPSGRGVGGEGSPERHSCEHTKGSRYSNTILFIDARHIFRQLDRAHRDFTAQQIEFLANIVRLYRGEEPENLHDSFGMLEEYGFPIPMKELPSPSGRGVGGEGYVDVPGLCKVATIREIKDQGWSLNPGRYVGVAEREEDDFNFRERLEGLNEELELLNAEARELEEQIGENVVKLLEGKTL